jgi:hypothetical protein
VLFFAFTTVIMEVAGEDFEKDEDRLQIVV